MVKLRKLPRALWEELQWQYERTPDPSEGYAASGEHYKLVEILRRCGYIAKDRWEAVDLAHRLLALGPADDKHAGGDSEDDYYASLADQG